LLSKVFVKPVENAGMYSNGSFALSLFENATNTFYDHPRRERVKRKL
jgi:hypothetical protein